jgi:two-component system phosphate regulon sensor histidine kinase PhoR
MSRAWSAGERPGLLVRLLAPYLFTLVAVAASLYAYSDRVVEKLYVQTLSDGLLREVHLAGPLLPWDVQGEALDRRCAAVAAGSGARVTVIAADGTVLGDSDTPSVGLENHGERPEVVEALRQGDGQAMRVSASVNRRLLYRAWSQRRDRDGQTEQRVIRLAISMSTIEQVRRRIRAAIWGGFLVAALAAFWPALVLSRRLSRRLSRLTHFSSAVAAGAPAPLLVPEGSDILGRLETNLLGMAESLSSRLQTARAEQGKLEAVLSGMVEGVLVIDSSGTIRLANQRAERLFHGSPARGLLGQLLINVSRDPDLHELVREVTRGDHSVRLLCEITLENGGKGESLQVTATPIAEPSGDLPLFILVFHDVTELKQLERTRRDFVANVSHELRTPLTAIRGYAETLRERLLDDPEQTRKFLEIIERHAERLTRLTEDLLALSDLELGRAALRRVPTAVAAAVEAAVEVVRDKAEQGGVSVCRELAPDLPPLWGDPDRIEQVLVNLLDNAVKFTPPGGRVTVSAHVAEPPQRDSAEGTAGRWIAICVADTGAGVPKHHLHRLTERFYRVDQARSRELGGTGLGLAIVKHIVQAHGGTLRIESEVGRGTQVYAYLPAAEADAPG